MELKYHIAMSTNSGFQIGVLAGGYARNPFAGYVTEILDTQGFSYEVTEDPCGGYDVIVVPELDMPQDLLERLWEAANRGVGVVAMRPNYALLPLFGLTSDSQPCPVIIDGHLRLTDSTVLQFHGPADVVECIGAEPLAFLERSLDSDDRLYPAIVRYEDIGRRAAFTFDLAWSSVLFHQGKAEQAGDGEYPDPDDDGIFKLNDMQYGYLDGRLKDVPQDDVLQSLFSELVWWVAEGRAVIPRTWHFPDRAPAVALVTGDSDHATEAELTLAFDTCQKRGVGYTLCLMSEHYDLISPDRASELISQGHDIEPHPWLSATPSVADYESYLPAAVREFADRYNRYPSACRMHKCALAGWTETQEMLSATGVRLDLNAYPMRLFQSGYLTGSALPVRLADRTGQIVDIYQQCTILADDAMLTDKCGMPAKSVDSAITLSLRLLDDLVNRYHGVFHVCFHPVWLRSGDPCSMPWFEAVLDGIQARNIPAPSAHKWAEFCDGRRLTSVTVSDDGKWVVQSDRPVTGLTLLFPGDVQSIFVDGVETELGQFEHVPNSRAIVLDIEPGRPITLSRTE